MSYVSYILIAFSTFGKRDPPYLETQSQACLKAYGVTSMFCGLTLQDQHERLVDCKSSYVKLSGEHQLQRKAINEYTKQRRGSVLKFRVKPQAFHLVGDESEVRKVVLYTFFVC